MPLKKRSVEWSLNDIEVSTDSGDPVQILNEAAELFEELTTNTLLGDQSQSPETFTEYALILKRLVRAASSWGKIRYPDEDVESFLVVKNASTSEPLSNLKAWQSPIDSPKDLLDHVIIESTRFLHSIAVVRRDAGKKAQQPTSVAAKVALVFLKLVGIDAIDPLGDNFAARYAEALSSTGVCEIGDVIRKWPVRIFQYIEHNGFPVRRIRVVTGPSPSDSTDFYALESNAMSVFAAELMRIAVNPDALLVQAESIRLLNLLPTVSLPREVKSFFNSNQGSAAIGLPMSLGSMIRQHRG